MANAVWRGCETESDVYLAVLPVYHMFGMLYNLFVSAFVPAMSSSGLAMLLHYPLMRGRPLVMLNDGFEPDRFCKAIEDYKVTTLMLVPPILLTLSTHAGNSLPLWCWCLSDWYETAVDKYDLRTLTNVVSGAAPLSSALANKFLGRLKSRGVNVYLLQGKFLYPTMMYHSQVMYSVRLRLDGNDMSRPDCSPRRLDKKVRKRRTITSKYGGANYARNWWFDWRGNRRWGRTAWGTVVKRTNNYQGILNITAGQLRFISCQGYLNNPSANESSFTVDGWFKTGDILRRDQDGYFYIVDRKKEMIKYKVCDA